MFLQTFTIGIEDRQTVRMQVGTREVFVTFRVSPLLREEP